MCYILCCAVHFTNICAADEQHTHSFEHSQPAASGTKSSGKSGESSKKPPARSNELNGLRTWAWDDRVVGLKKDSPRRAVLETRKRGYKEQGTPEKKTKRKRAQKRATRNETNLEDTSLETEPRRRLAHLIEKAERLRDGKLIGLSLTSAGRGPLFKAGGCPFSSEHQVHLTKFQS